MREDGPRSPLEQLRSRGQVTLYQLRRALEAAAKDPKLTAIIAEISAPSIGLATAQELHDLLQTAVAAKKRVVAVLAGDSVTVRDYLIASGASEVVINPDTALMMLGAALGSFFLRNALGKLGVEAQTLQWKEYKGAAEIFNRETMSPEVRESLDAIVADWKTILAEKVAAAARSQCSEQTSYSHRGLSAPAPHANAGWQTALAMSKISAPSSIPTMRKSASSASGVTCATSVTGGAAASASGSPWCTVSARWSAASLR